MIDFLVRNIEVVTKSVLKVRLKGTNILNKKPRLAGVNILGSPGLTRWSSLISFPSSIFLLYQ
jgi:hypothetical protein